MFNKIMQSSIVHASHNYPTLAEEEVDFFLLGWKFVNKFKDYLQSTVEMMIHKLTIRSSRNW